MILQASGSSDAPAYVSIGKDAAAARLSIIIAIFDMILIITIISMIILIITMRWSGGTTCLTLLV